MGQERELKGAEQERKGTGTEGKGTEGKGTERERDGNGTGHCNGTGQEFYRNETGWEELDHSLTKHVAGELAELLEKFDTQVRF